MTTATLPVDVLSTPPAPAAPSLPLAPPAPYVRLRVPLIEVAEPGQPPMLLNASPAAGHALGALTHAGTVYYYMNERVEPTDEDGARWAALHRRG